MAVRITHTNNSQGHDGTYVYRSTSPMDPQNLPAPIADEPPVALGETFEYIDSPADGAYYYRTQDHEGGQVSAASSEASIQVGFNAQIGDEVEGGVYAGTITYGDNRQFHIIAAKQSGEASSLRWGDYGVTTGVTNPDDGFQNQQDILTNHDSGNLDAFYHCRDYASGGKDDWYLPAKNELKIVADNMRAISHPEFTTATTGYRWTSTENNSYNAFLYNFSASKEIIYQKNGTSGLYVRPIRRVAV